MKKGYQEEPIKFLPAQWYEGQKTDLYESTGYSGEKMLYRPTGPIEVGYAGVQQKPMAVQPVELVTIDGKSPMADKPKSSTEGIIYIFGYEPDEKPENKGQYLAADELWSLDGKSHFPEYALAKARIQYEAMPKIRKVRYQETGLEKRFEEIVKSTGKSRYKIAKEAGISWQSLDRWLADPTKLLTAGFASVMNLSKILEVTPEELYNIASKS